MLPPPGPPSIRHLHPTATGMHLNPDPGKPATQRGARADVPTPATGCAEGVDRATEVEGDCSYATVTDIPDGVDGVVIVTAPEAAPLVVADCARAGVPRVWLHRGMGPGSSSPDAVRACQEHGIAVIPGGCPNMFGATSDGGHRAMLKLLQATGKIPSRIERP